MPKFLWGFFTRNPALKILSFILAILMWFYIVNELNRGSHNESQVLRKHLRAKTGAQSGAVHHDPARKKTR